MRRAPTTQPSPPALSRGAREVDPVLAAEGERWIASWFDKEREAQEHGLHGSELLQWRQQHIAPLVKGFKA